MLPDHPLEVIRVESSPDRELALQVMRAIYRDEKNWLQADEKLVSEADLSRPEVSWFTALDQGQPVGVLRVLYAPPLDLYREYGFKLVAGGFDLDRFLRESRIAEIGRFAVVPLQRHNPGIAVALMKAACTETVRRGFTHYITDVFEGEAHSPYRFHTRVMGFKTVATHDVGELNCPNRRLTMILDLREAYNRLGTKSARLLRYLTQDWSADMHARMRDPAVRPAGIA